MSAARTYDIGDKPRAVARFADVEGNPVTPTSITVKVKNPSGLEVAYTSPHISITTPLPGVVVFEFPAVLDVDGVWFIRIIGTAGVNAAVEASFIVRPSAFLNP